MKNSLIARYTALAALTLATFTLNAAEPLRSPRALAQRSQPSTGVTADRLDRAAFATPKAASLKAKVVAGTEASHAQRSASVNSGRLAEHSPLAKPAAAH